MVDATVTEVRSDFYVYVIFRPNGEPCYVGKGLGKRWLVHEKSKHGYRNPRLAKIIENADGDLPKIKVRENLTEAEAFRTEIAMIAAIGRSSRGPLVNMTDGGDGTSGLDISPERRAATSARHKGKTISLEQRTRQAEASASRVWSRESIEKISMSNRGKVRSAETIAQMKIRAAIQWAQPEMKARIATANAARIWTPESRAKCSLAQRRRAKERAEKCQTLLPSEQYILGL